MDDVYATMDELRAKGVKILNEPVRTSMCVMGFIEDPFGSAFQAEVNDVHLDVSYDGRS